MLERRPNYLLWSLPFFYLGILYERAVNPFGFLAGLRVDIVVVFEKEEGEVEKAARQ